MSKAETPAKRKPLSVRGTLARPKPAAKPEPAAKPKASGTAPTPHILLATPSYGDSFCNQYVHTAMQISRWAALSDIALSTRFFSYADIAAARNILLSQFYYDHPQATHMLFIDDDMGLPKDLLPAALALKADLVGALYPKRSVDLKALHKGGALPYAQALAKASSFVGRLSKARKTNGIFATADYIGTGFMLISRAGLERFLEKCPEHRAKDRYRSVLPDWKHPDFLTPFDRMVVDGREFAEDYAFCLRWRNAGFEIWAAPGADITHSGTMVFRTRQTDL